MKVLFFLSYSNLFVALCAASLCTFCHLFLFNEPPGWVLIGFVFSATLFAYNFHRRLGMLYKKSISPNGNPPESIDKKNRWITANKATSHWIIMLSFCSSLLFLYLLPKEALTLVFPLAILSLLYILQVSKIPSLRSIPFLKIFVIAFVWGGVMVLLPILSASESYRIFNFESQALALAIGLFVFGETVPFDIRDLNEDRATKIKTIPLKIGLQKSKLLSFILYTVSGLLFLSVIVYFGKPQIFGLSFLLSLLFSYLIIYQVNAKKKELYYSLMIESSLSFPLIFYLFLSNLP